MFSLEGIFLVTRLRRKLSRCLILMAAADAAPVAGRLPAMLKSRAYTEPGTGEGWLPLEAILHYTLRERARKTVMTAKDSQPTHGVEPGEKGAPAADRKALDHLFSVTYEELRRLASSVRRGDPSATLSPTALVNEAWIKLAKSPDIGATSRLHFKRIAARAMRQLLVEAARRRNSGKRGGAEITVTFDEAVQKKPSGGAELLALNTALDSLERMNPRQAVMVESRFFGGLDVPETAALLNVSEATVLRDWRAAKAWLAQQLREASS
jgi:RNA polymerase sigma factor (TIGR02999 family)